MRETYFSFVFERYERELLSVGGTIDDFLSNIDALHPHIRSHDHIIPACGTVLLCMRCTRDHTNTCLYLHVHQARDDLKHFYGTAIITKARRNSNLPAHLYPLMYLSTLHMQIIKFSFKIIGQRPPPSGVVWRPPSGKSWICHWLPLSSYVFVAGGGGLEGCTAYHHHTTIVIKLGNDRMYFCF